jgi:hypothetical protein
MADSAEPTIPLVVPIGTRDGTLTKDSKMVNCFAEQDEMGWAAVKRPGTTVGATVPSGTPQGIGIHNGGVWAFVNDLIYRIDLGGTPSSTFIPGVTVPGQQYQFLSDIVVGMSGFKSQTGGWAINVLTITKITDANYPPLTCVGAAWLNGTTYVVDINPTSGRNILRASALNDPLTWPPLNFLATSTASGAAVYICNYLTYVAVFTVYGLQMYYDAGNPTGIPLLPVQSATWLTGCATPYSVVKVVDDLYFVSNSTTTGYAISVLRGLTISKISTPAIDRILSLQTFSIVSAQAFQTLGHSFYAIEATLGGSSVAITYDITTGSWAQWTSIVGGSEVAFVGIHCLTLNQVYYMQDRISGTCLLLSSTATQDDIGTVRGTQPIYTRIVTRPYDWATLKRKFMTAVYFIADTVSATVALSYTDDDYQTFSNPRTIDFSTVKKYGLRFGSSRRRAWQILHTAATTFKAYSMEVDVDKSAE